jgi:two-component system phosphate regulon sensor histidine kinase PhoR
MAKSLKARLLSITLLTIVCMIGLLSIYLSMVSRHYLLNITLKGMEPLARLTAENISISLTGPASVDLDSLADGYSGITGYRITIIDSAGRVLGDSEEDGANLAAMDNHLGRPEIRTASRTGSGHSLRYSQTIKKELIYLAVPISVRGTPWGYCRIAWPFTDFASYRWHLFFSLLTGFLIAASLLIFIYNAHWNAVIKSINKLEEAVARISGGDLSARASTNQGSAELNFIAESLNKLARSWENTLSDRDGQRLRLSAVLQSMSEGVLVIDNRQRITMINAPACRMFGLEHSDCQGKLLIEVIRHPDIGEWSRHCSSGLEFAVGNKSYLVHGSPLESNKQDSDIVIVVTDITYYKRLENIRKDFVANVSHELKTPLSAIIGYSQALNDGNYQNQDQMRDFLERIYSQSERMNRIVSDLLTLSSFETGSYAINLQPVPLKDLVQRAVDNIQQPASQKKQAILVKDIPDSCQIMADEIKMIQALTNLLDNASKYTPEGGRIEVSVELKDNIVRIMVSDNGSGIPSEHLPRIFERFYRVDKGRSREMGGTGLGLAIVKHIVEMHQGKVGVSSQIGKGSEFWAELPI